MILLKYSKLLGAEYIPHLDTLKHLGKIIRRTGLEVNYSQGFNPHMLIFMSAPLPLGLKSKSEYLLISTDTCDENFIEKFNNCSPLGIKAQDMYFVKSKLNIANDITSATFSISGLNNFDVNDVLSSNEFIILDKNGKEKNVRDRILSLHFENNILICSLKAGNENLRPDVFSNKLKSVYGGGSLNIIKEDVKFLNNLSVTEYIAEKDNV